MQELREEVENWGGQARELQRVSRREVADLPPDTQVGFSITFCYGSADPCLWLIDPDPDFSAHYFLNVHLHRFSKIKSQKEVKKQ
jgi:hypothetical protein